MDKYTFQVSLDTHGTFELNLMTNEDAFIDKLANKQQRQQSLFTAIQVKTKGKTKKESIKNE